MATSQNYKKLYASIKANMKHDDIKQTLEYFELPQTNRYLQNISTLAQYLNKNLFAGVVNNDTIDNFIVGNESEYYVSDIHDDINYNNQLTQYYKDYKFRPVYDEKDFEDEYKFNDIHDNEEYANSMLPYYDDIKFTQEIAKIVDENSGAKKQRKDTEFHSTTELKNADEEVVNKIVERLYKDPFHTKVIFAEYNEEIGRTEIMPVSQQNMLMPRIKKWFEEVILTQPVNKKMWYKFMINGQWRTRNLHDIETRELFYNMLNGSRVFNLEDYNDKDGFYKQFELPPLQLIDAFMITTIDENALRKSRSKKDAVNNTHESGFFEYSLKQEYIQLECFTKELQIFNKLTDDSNKKLRKELRMPCIVYALSTVIDDEDTLMKIHNRIATDYLDIKHLRPIFEEFSINGTVRYLRDDDNTLRKSHTKNNNTIGPKNAKYHIDLISFRNHYFVYKTIPLNLFYIRHYNEVNAYANANNKSFEWCCAADCIRNGVPHIKNSKAKCTTYDLVKTLFEVDAFTPYSYYDFQVQITGLHKLITNTREPEDLSYNANNCTRLIVDKQTESTEQEHTYWYADFETCPEDDGHKPFLLCLSNREGTINKSFYGIRCAQLFMDYIPDNSIVYFHNLGYDGRFLRKFNTVQSIDKGTRIMKQVSKYNNKTITFKDTFSMLTQPLCRFPAMFPSAFKNTNIKKELFPYKYYNYKRVLSHQELNPIGIISDVGIEDNWTDAQKQEFTHNVNTIPDCKVDDDHFNMRVYAQFYCEQDVNVLRLGYNTFRMTTLQEPICLDVDNFISAASLANEYMNRKVFRPNGNIYEVSGVVLDFLMKAVYGGRCMTRENKRWHVSDELDDFDAVSLYPSAMSRLWTVEGRPHVLTPELLGDGEYNISRTHPLLQHVFTENQTQPTEDKYISAFVVDIEITNIGINRQFPLIVKRDPITKTNMNVNECCNMTVDNIMLEDLIRFQHITYRVIKGYFYTGNRDHRIRTAITQLFNERLVKKKEGSPLQETLKLIMNSAYGKSMQKPIQKDMKYMHKNKIDAYRCAHYYNYIEDITVDDSDTAIVLTHKKLFNQFNNCLFGVQVLSMSKRIMNEVMCLAEDLHLDVYYQDTDSNHIKHEHVPILAREFEKQYGRPLIGTSMGCFHSDFDELKHNPISIESYFLGKKTYIDLLRNDKGEHAFHIRMKGIPIKTIQHVVKTEYHNDPMCLYALMYHGDEVQFDLCKGRVQFTYTKGGTVVNETSFIRRVKATSV